MSLAVALDAMGGDLAPAAIVAGAVEAAQSLDVFVFLVGREAQIRSELGKLSWSGENIQIVNAEHVIDMGDSPVGALRKKRGSSIEVAIRLVESGEADAFVSAGNTGACVAGATLLLGLLPEVRRAGIAVTIHASDKPVVVIDVGANVASKPEHLIQYGIMASLFAREGLRMENPRVGLLNVGAESEKGNSLVKATRNLFQNTNLNFIGNVEGSDVFRGNCDVVVCDGFVGNTLLKVSEGLAECLVGHFKDAVKGSLSELPKTLGLSGGEHSQDGAAQAVELVFSRVFEKLRRKVDYAEFGGAPLLGTKGLVMISHGRSDARAVANAIRMACRMAEGDVNTHITREIRNFSCSQQVPESR